MKLKKSTGRRWYHSGAQFSAIAAVASVLLLLLLLLYFMQRVQELQRVIVLDAVPEEFPPKDAPIAVPAPLQNTLQLYAQYAAISSFCTFSEPRPGPCLQNWDQCVQRLAEMDPMQPDREHSHQIQRPFLAQKRVTAGGPMAPALTLGTRILHKFSTYADTKWNGGEGLILVNDHVQTVIVGIKGSTVIADWINDFQFWMSEYPWNGAPHGTKVHSGVFDVYKNLRSVALRGLTEVFWSNATLLQSYKLVITGHSLGAALASLLALDLRVHQQLGPNSTLNAPPLPVETSITLFSFAQPRTGNEMWVRFFDRFFDCDNGDERARSFRCKAFRIVQKQDIVPMLPPEVFRYAHFGRSFIWIDWEDDGIAGQYPLQTLQCTNDHYKGTGAQIQSEKPPCVYHGFHRLGHASYFWNFDTIRDTCAEMHNL